MMDEERPPHPSELFTVRLWPEELGEGEIEWRGRVQHALSGRSGYFRDWSGLLAFFSEFLATETITASGQRET
jgi:hypothetical protein